MRQFTVSRLLMSLMCAMSFASGTLRGEEVIDDAMLEELYQEYLAGAGEEEAPGQDIVFNLPFFGSIQDWAEQEDGTYQATHGDIKSGAVHFKQGTFTLDQGQISYTGEGKFFDVPVVYELSEAGFAEGIGEGDAQTVVVSQAVFVAKAKDAKKPLSIAGLTAQQATISVDRTAGAKIELEGELRGQKFALSGTYDLQEMRLALTGTVPQLRVNALFPELQETFIGNYFLKGTISVSTDEGVTFDCELRKEDGKSLVKVAGLDVERLKLNVNSGERAAVFSGSTKLLGLPTTLKGELQLGEEKHFRLSAQVQPGVDKIQPFKSLPQKQLQDITLYDIEATAAAEFEKKAGGDSQQGSVDAGIEAFITGSADILDTKTRVTAKIHRPVKKGAETGMTLIAELPDGWKLSQNFPEAFKGDNDLLKAINALKLESVRYVVSTSETVIGGEPIGKGLNFQAAAAIDREYDEALLRILKGVVTHVGDDTARIWINGAINPLSPKTASLRGGITSGGYGFDIGQAHVSGGRLSLVLRGEPSLGVEGSIKLRPFKEADPLNFAVEIMFTPIKGGIAGSMKGTWKDPFGIKGFEFGDLGLKGTITYDSIAEVATSLPTAGISALAGLVPGDIGLTGSTTIGEGDTKFGGEVKANFGKDVSSTAIEVHVKEPLNIVNLLGALQKQAVDIKGVDLSKIKFPIEVQRAQLKFVPFGTTVGNIKIDQGIGGHLYTKIFGKEAYADFKVGSSGIVAKGGIPAFDLGPLSVSGFEKDSDLTMGMEFTEEAQNIDISGDVKLGDIIHDRANIQLSPSGFAFDMSKKLKIGEGKEAKLNVKARSIMFEEVTDVLQIAPEDIRVKFSFDDTLTQALNNILAQSVKKASDAVQKKINKEIENFARKKIEEDIRKKRAKIKQLKDRRQQWIAAALKI